MSDQDRPPRTAAATEARRRIGEEQRAEFLRSRGWVCIPPGAVKLTAVVRPVIDANEPHVRVAVIGPPAAGGRPRADLDGLGPREVTAFYVAESLPQRQDQLAAMAGLTECLAASGYRVGGAWTVGRDPHGRYASVPVARIDPHGSADR